MKINNRGLTLIELLAVIAIIAILFVLLIPQISNAINKSKETGVLTDLKDYQRAVTSYFYEKNELPKNFKDLNPFLDDALKFKVEGFHIVSKKNNPYKNNDSVNGYVFFYLSEDYFRIYTVVNKTDNMNIYFKIKDGELHSWTKGLSNELNSIKKSNEQYIYSIINNQEIEILEYIGGEKDIIIPSTIDGYPVTRIIDTNSDEKKAFYGKGLKSVILPETIETIGFAAFYGNEITNLKLPLSLKALRNDSFTNNPITTYTVVGNPLIQGSAFPTTAIRK